MTKNSNLHAARKARSDEFYTRLEDVEAELQHYPNAFRGKVVYLNCDDERSAFWRYFSRHFEELGLKKLVATKYPEGTMLVKDGEYSTHVKLSGDGDFRSPECIAVLERSDTVVTNPPFSKFRALIEQLNEHGKEFLLLGNLNAVTYKEVWPLIQAGELWLGGTPSYLAFRVPADSPPKSTRFWVDEEGCKWRSLGNGAWVTNLDCHRRHQPLPLTKKYTSEDFPKYSNYDAIEVSRVKDIPADYDGVMGVPITFLGKHNPEQFEIVGFYYGDDGQFLRLADYMPYRRILIRRRQFDKV